MHALRAWRLRGKRRRFLLRALLKRGELKLVSKKLENASEDAVLAFACMRNEALRLPHFLEYYRKLGVDHFIIVDNDSRDDTRKILETQADVSLWATPASYRKSRFGMDWVNHLLAVYGAGHWCLTVDADELLAFEDPDGTGLRGLTKRLDQVGQVAFGALMLDLYPKGPLGEQTYTAGDTPLNVLEWFDPGPYRTRIQPFMQNLWVQGGPRARMFFAKTPDQAPTLNKTPLVKWHWRYAYMNSTHTLLPPKLNVQRLEGALLHTKFLPTVTTRAAEEKGRGEHFGVAQQYARYYDAVIAAPDLWYEGSNRYEGWEQLSKLGLLDCDKTLAHGLEKE